MERLKERYALLMKAINTLDVGIRKLEACADHDEDYGIIRDSVIKRFEYTVDTFWKFLKEFLQKKQGIEPAASPSKVFRQCLDAGILTNQEYAQALKIIEDRNMTSHTYNEILADEISGDIPEHYLVINSVICRIGENPILFRNFLSIGSHKY